MWWVTTLWGAGCINIGNSGHASIKEHFNSGHYEHNHFPSSSWKGTRVSSHSWLNASKPRAGDGESHRNQTFLASHHHINLKICFLTSKLFNYCNYFQFFVKTVICNYPSLQLISYSVLLCRPIIQVSSRPRWSRSNVLASRSKVPGFKSSWGRWIFSGRKNPEHKSSGRT